MRQLVHPGDDAYITCSAQGDEPITIYWSAVDGPLPRTASFYRGLLQVKFTQTHYFDEYTQLNLF